MTLGMIIAMLIAGWMAVAAAMLWGVLRVSRRHHRPETLVEKPAEDELRQHRQASTP